MVEKFLKKDLTKQNSFLKLYMEKLFKNTKRDLTREK